MYETEDISQMAKQLGNSCNVNWGFQQFELSVWGVPVIIKDYCMHSISSYVCGVARDVHAMCWVLNFRSFEIWACSCRMCLKETESNGQHTELKNHQPHVGVCLRYLRASSVCQDTRTVILLFSFRPL